MCLASRRLWTYISIKQPSDYIALRAVVSFERRISAISALQERREALFIALRTSVRDTGASRADEEIHAGLGSGKGLIASRNLDGPPGFAARP